MSLHRCVFWETYVTLTEKQRAAQFESAFERRSVLRARQSRVARGETFYHAEN